MGTQLVPAERAAIVQLFEQNAPIQKILQTAERSIAAAIRGPIEAQPLIRQALLTVSMSPALQKCSKLSIVQCVMQSASLGLMVGGPTGEAAMVPYKGEAKLLPMVRGLVTLAMRSGLVLAVTPRLVYPDDTFDIEYGTVDRIVHKPALASKRRADDDVLYAYAVFKMAGGVTHFDVMTRDEIEQVRAVSRSGKDPDSPWVKWWGEQAKKTVVKRGSKMVPLSAEFRAAVELDNRHETGTINEASALLDSAEEVQAHVADVTATKTENLRERLNKSTPKAEKGPRCEACGGLDGAHQNACPYAPEEA